MASPGRPARLTRQRVVAAAEAVVRTDGIAALSMRRVARELRCSPMALYRHVTGRDELLGLLIDHIAGTLRRPEPSAQPRRTVTRVLTITHDWLVAHPWAVDMLRSHRMEWSASWIADDVLSAFLAAGLSPAAAARAYEIVWHHLVGELTTRHAGHAVRPSRRRTDPSEGLPTVVALADHTAAARAHDQYLLGLSALLDGLLRPT